MALPQELSKKVSSLSKQVMLVYGRPKIGKSTLCSKFDGALFLATEPGLSHFEIYKQDITTWLGFVQACKEIAEGKHNVRTSRTPHCCSIASDKLGSHCQQVMKVGCMQPLHIK